MWPGRTSHLSSCFILQTATTTVCGRTVPSSDVPTVPSEKHPAKIHVWDMFSYRAVPAARGASASDHQQRVLRGHHPGH